MGNIVLVSPCGTGNLGDAAIQDSMIAGIRQRYPHARILGVTLNPRDTEQRHGLTTFPIAVMDGGVGGSPVLGDRGAGGSAALGEEQASRLQHRSLVGSFKNLLRRSVALVRRVIRKAARLILPGSLCDRLGNIRDEAEHLIGAWRHLDGVDTLIFSGGGQLGDEWGGAGGHPWAMFKWALLARLRGARVLFLSVGYTTLSSRRSRLLTRLALGLAEYRSYRDSGSLNLLRGIGFTRMDPVVPDLAYARPDRHVRGPLAGPVQTVGICPMAYCDPRGWPVHDRSAFEDYLERLVQVAVWLVGTGRRLVFFASGGADNRVADEVTARLSDRLEPGQEGLIRRAPVTSVDGFLQQSAAVDVVVASRLHSLLLSHLTGTPTIAFSYERKVDVLMREMEQESYALNIDTFSACDFRRAFTALEANWHAIYDRLLNKQREYRRLLQTQFDQVLVHDAERLDESTALRCAHAAAIHQS
jgi:polysaccharide pyruvyl transferase WcaK-like protein